MNLNSTTGIGIESGLYCMCGCKMIYSVKYDRWFCPHCSVYD